VTARWTFMTYLAGYNNLADFASKDIGEMQAVGSSDDVQVAVFVERLGDPGARRFLLDRHGAPTDVEELGDVDSGSPQTLADFIAWVGRTAPAEHYALVIWNHGSGWQPDDLEDLYHQLRREQGASAPSAREVSVLTGDSEINRALFTPTLKGVLELPSMRARGIASDDGSGHSLDTVELGSVLERAAADLGGPLELLGMDACLMSNLEVGYQGRRSVRHIVASEELEPGDGWPYTDILRALTDDPGMTGADLGRTIVETYVASYAGTSEVVTQCAVDTTRMDAFAQAVDSLATALRGVLADQGQRSAILGARARSVEFHGELVDVTTFCDQLLVVSTLDDKVREAARAVLDELAPGRFVVAEGHAGDGVDGVGGVTLYFPSPFEEASRFYRDTAFATERGWDEFLAAFAAAVRST
jgi:hypothetical protein